MTIAFIPGGKYPSISITGTVCRLKCKYCGGKYLNHMLQAPTPQKLYFLVQKLWEKNVKGILISGGFNREGCLPLKQFLPTIRKIKRDFDLIISIHSGLIEEKTIVDLKKSGIDIVDYEFVVDDFVIENIMNLKSKSHKDFVKTLEILYKKGPPYIAPHIPIGFNYGNITLEYKALEYLVEYNPYIIIFLVLIPTRGTEMEHVKAPDVTKIVDLIGYARTIYNGEIALGCMRPPYYKQVLDHILLERNLVDRIVLPNRRMAKKFRLKTINACCSIPREYLNRFD